MNPDIKAKWLAALRGDAYMQGTCKLRQGNCYCVWGVLCDIVSPAGWENIDTGHWKHHDSFTYPSFMVRLKSGINEGQDYLKIHKLINMNDAGRPFTELADFIEENF